LVPGDSNRLSDLFFFFPFIKGDSPLFPQSLSKSSSLRSRNSVTSAAPNDDEVAFKEREARFSFHNSSHSSPPLFFSSMSSPIPPLFFFFPNHSGSSPSLQSSKNKHASSEAQFRPLLCPPLFGCPLLRAARQQNTRLHRVTFAAKDGIVESFS